MGVKGNLLNRINNQIPDSVKELLGFVGNICTILVPLGSLIGLIVSWVKDGTQAEESWKNYVIIVLLLVIGILFYRFFKQKKEHIMMQEKIINKYTDKINELKTVRLNERYTMCKMYYQLLHDYRNIINDIEHSYKIYELTDTELTIMVTSFLENALDYLTTTLKEMTGYEISGCVKAIIGGNSGRISYEDAKVKTFVRSHNTNPARKSLDQQDEEGVWLRDNTDFLEIVAEDRNNNISAFYQPNLKEYAERLKIIGKVYKNSNPHWDEYYIGTVVVPIRIASKRLFYLGNGKKRRKKKNKYIYYTLGFLCVDSLSDEAFTWEQKDNYIYIVKAYAATMFNILSKNQFYLTKLHQEMTPKSDVNQDNHSVTSKYE